MKGGAVAIDEDALARIEEFLGTLPPPDLDSYRMGYQAAIADARQALEALAGQLTTRASTVATEDTPVSGEPSPEVAQAQRAMELGRVVADVEKGRRKKTKPA